MTNESPPNNGLKNVWQNQKVEGIRMSAEDIRRKAGKFRKKIFWRNAREYVAALVVVTFFGYQFGHATDTLTRVGLGLTIAGMVSVAWQLYRRGSSRSLPTEMGLASGLEFFKRELERQRDLLRSVAKWYLGPLIPGLLVILVGTARANPRHLPYIGLFFAGYCLLVVFGFVLIWKLNQQGAGKLQRRIDELDALQKQQ